MLGPWVLRRAGEVTWAACHTRTSSRDRSGSSSTPCTTSTTAPDGPACACWPGRPAAAPPRCPRCSPPPASRPGASWSCWSRRWTATSESSADCGWRRAHRRRAESTAPLIAGRRPELAAVRRHVQEGAGLLMVTGEAGMGKTRLVTAAASLSAGTTFVAVGSCLPLAIDVPLLPVADLLRSTYARDGGRWLTEALADCAPYVAESVQRLVPELEPVVGAPPAPEDGWSRQRLFGAVGSTLEALASRHPLAVLLEDLHWADSATLDLVEHLIARRVAVPVLGTWRLDDPATPEHTAQWWTRVQRLPTATTLALQPLSREETAEQLELLVGRPGRPGPGRPDPPPQPGPATVHRAAGRPGRRAAHAPVPGGPAGPPPRRPRSRGLAHRPRARGRGPRPGRRPADRHHGSRQCRPGRGAARARRTPPAAPLDRAPGRAGAPPPGGSRPATPRRPGVRRGAPPDRGRAGTVLRSVGRRGRRALAARRRPRPRRSSGGSAPHGRPRNGSRWPRRAPSGAGRWTCGRPPTRPPGHPRCAGARPTSRRWTHWSRSTWRPPGALPRRACATCGWHRRGRGRDLPAGRRDHGTDGRPRGWAGPRRPGDRPARTDRPVGRLRPCTPPTQHRCWTTSAGTTRPGPPRHGPWRRAPTSTSRGCSGAS